ncbi:hypothetical protein DEO72_LG6g1298 [Vigna unguiculata]|uniref:Uncharacterized protein n=1 Tax=Vigna unguiculata TaxID=3917 RepID=A0A4D6M5L9_VIGUN|nr:hypothetical protein DEO72_LG6g1298 [Vigna unguiculata]
MVLRKLAVARDGGCAASAAVAFCSDLAQAWRFEDGGGAARGGDARHGVAAVMEIAGAVRERRCGEDGGAGFLLLARCCAEKMKVAQGADSWWCCRCWCSGVAMMVALRRRWRRKLGRGGVGGDASLQNRGGRKRRWLPWRLMVAARVWGKLGFLFWEMKMMTWQNLIG